MAACTGRGALRSVQYVQIRLSEIKAMVYLVAQSVETLVVEFCFILLLHLSIL